MFHIIKIITISMLLLILFACSSTHAPVAEEERDDPKVKIKTAKINAQLGIAYLEDHNIQRAKKKLLIALDQAPNIPETWYSMGYFYEATGNYEEASKHYLKAISVAPKRGDAQNNYGTFLCRTGDYRNAVQHFLMAAKDPDYLNPADAYENAGLCAMKIPHDNSASQYFKQALLQDPSRTVSLLKLAEISYKNGEYTLARDRLNQYLSLSTAPTEQAFKLRDNLEQKLARQEDDTQIKKIV